MQEEAFDKYSFVVLDEALRLVPPQDMGLEKSLEWINDDELVEVTPQSIRIRKAILDKHDRKKAMRK